MRNRHWFKFYKELILRKLFQNGLLYVKHYKKDLIRPLLVIGLFRYFFKFKLFFYFKT